MRRFRVLILMALVGAGSAHADLYRWRDPDTGSIKYSTVPPPWLKGGSGPSTQVIPYQSPAAKSAPAPGADPAGGALPPSRVAVPPAGATKTQLVDAVLVAMRMRDQFAGMSAAMESALDQGFRRIDTLDESARRELQGVARSTFGADRLYGHFAAAFAAEAREADLRELIEFEQTPFGRRVAEVELARTEELARMMSAGNRTLPQPLPDRRALAQELESAVGGADMMIAVAAGVMAGIATQSRDEDRTRIAAELQRLKAQIRPQAQASFVSAMAFLYEPLTDAELRQYIEVQKRPGMARLNRAIALGMSATLQESLAEFIALAKPFARVPRT